MSDKVPSKKDETDGPDQEESPEPPRSLALDLGDDCVYNVDANRLGNQSGSGSSQETSGINSKREDNPFSFKHFLRDNSNSNRNYQSLGAKPKVYRGGNQVTQESPQRPRNHAEFSAALPDFVQDHLVIEQCFLGKKTAPSASANIDLPYYSQGNVNGPTVSRSNSMEEPIPLDLPGLSVGNSFPLDLPVSDCRTALVTEQVGNSKSLPDFLTDGPVRNNASEVATPSPTIDGGPLRDSSLCRRCVELTTELSNLRQRLTRTDDESEANYRRATTAENAVAKLKQELKSLKAQMRRLQAENEALKDGEGGAVGGGSGDPPIEFQVQRLAHDLRMAAGTAEQSLRSLLTGVDNLRLMASTLENVHRIEERSTDRFSRYGVEDESSGPAL